MTIQNVDFPLTGNFSCEVTTDAPHFTTASSSQVLTVVCKYWAARRSSILVRLEQNDRATCSTGFSPAVPKGKPVIVSERGRYEPGDTLQANCSTPASKPPARLSFTLNDLQVRLVHRFQSTLNSECSIFALARDSTLIFLCFRSAKST